MELDALYALLCEWNPEKKFFIAYSGGLDSHVLLHCLVQLRARDPQFKLTAIHINHQVSPHAASWAAHCEQVCQTLSVPCITKELPLKLEKKNLEAKLRQWRYELMASLLDAHSCLLTAHNQNDQAETLLLQLMRGAGIKGLAAMPLIMPLGKAKLGRPFLTISREELKNYALQNQLKWIEDESNDDLYFNRNFVRKKIIPLLEHRWPGAQVNLARATQHFAETEELLKNLAQKDLLECMNDKYQLNLSVLNLFSIARKKNVLRHWFRYLQLPVPSRSQLQQLIEQSAHPKQDTKMLLKWSGVEIRFYQSFLYVNSPSAENNQQQLTWDLRRELILPNQLGKLQATLCRAKGLLAKQNQPVTVRFRQAGERCQPQGRIGSHPLKKLFQEWKVPVWQRNQVPLIYVENQIAAVAGYCVCENFVTKEEQEGYLIQVIK